MFQGSHTGECRHVQGRIDGATDVLSVHEKIDELVKGAACRTMGSGVGLAAKNRNEFLRGVTLRLGLSAFRIPPVEVAEVFDHAEDEVSPGLGGAHR